jgi:hypothetical protein
MGVFIQAQSSVWSDPTSHFCFLPPSLSLPCTYLLLTHYASAHISALLEMPSLASHIRLGWLGTSFRKLRLSPYPCLSWSCQVEFICGGCCCLCTRYPSQVLRSSPHPPPPANPCPPPSCGGGDAVVWTQDFILAFYHTSHTSNPICSVYSGDRVLLFVQSGLD